MQEGSEWYRSAGTDVSFLVWTLPQALYANISLSLSPHASRLGKDHTMSADTACIYL